MIVSIIKTYRCIDISIYRFSPSGWGSGRVVGMVGGRWAWWVGWWLGGGHGRWWAWWVGLLVGMVVGLVAARCCLA